MRARVFEHNVTTYRLLRALRRYWLLAPGDDSRSGGRRRKRGLWFRRWEALDGRGRLGRYTTGLSRSGLSWVMGWRDEDTVGRGYVPVTGDGDGLGVEDDYDKVVVLDTNGRRGFIFLDGWRVRGFEWA